MRKEMRREWSSLENKRRK